MSFVVRSKQRTFLVAPSAVGESVGWSPARVDAWVFATRAGAERSRLMHAPSAIVEPVLQSPQLALDLD